MSEPDFIPGREQRIDVVNNLFGLEMRLYANNHRGHQIACYVIVTFIIMPLDAKLFVV